MTIERLKDMQIDENVLKDVLKLVIFQELKIDTVENVRKAKFDFFEY